MIKRIIGALILLAVIVIAVLAFLGREPDAAEIESAYFTEDDRIVSAAGMDWRVRETGPEDAPVLVLIHGFSHSLEAFDPWAAELEDAWRVIRFDLPGHALTGPREDGAYTVDDTVAQVSALLDEIAPDRFALGGNSLGGLIAWRYAAENPERVSALVLAAPGGFANLGVGEEPADVPAAVRMFLTSPMEMTVRPATERLYGDPERLSDADVTRITDLMSAPGVGQALAERVAVFTLPDPEAALAELDVPALILWGAQDAMIPVDHAERFDAAMPDAEVIVYEDLGHLPMEEDPERTAADVRAFLDARTD